MIRPKGQNTVRETPVHVGTVLHRVQMWTKTHIYLYKALAYPDKYDAAVMAASGRWNQHVERGCGHDGKAEHS